MAPPEEINELIAPEQRKVIEERNQWFYSLEEPRKQEKLFELELYLKGLDRFFNLKNQPISQKEGIVRRDFTKELRIIRNAVGKVVQLTKGLLTMEDNRTLHFSSYVETRLLSDYQRAKRVERALKQSTPEQSLFVLCHTFINFQEIIQNVVSKGENSYFLFYHLEQLISREIAGNRYFNPFKAAGFAPHYDVVKSPRFTKFVRGISDPVLKKHLSIIFLMMFKMLRYLNFVDSEERELSTLKDSLLIFSLVNSESMLLVDLFENEMPQIIDRCEHTSEQKKDELKSSLDALAYQLTVELEKIFELELRDAATATKRGPLRVGVARSRGLLTNIFQQGIVHVAQVLDHELAGKDVFPDFISKVDTSLKLRRDVWLFHKVVENIEQTAEQALASKQTIPLIEAIKTLRNFIYFYQNISFQYVRSMDRDEFQKFFGLVDSLNVRQLEDTSNLEKFRQDLHAFKMFLETTLASINNRAELRDQPFGREEGERILAQFLS